MQLIDRITYTRNIHGYMESTSIDIYFTWVRGVQAYVVYQPHNGENDARNATRHGLWFLSPESLTRFMCKFKESFRLNQPFKMKSIFEYDSASFRNALYNDASDVDDPNCYRVVIEDRVKTVVQRGFYRNYGVKRFGVVIGGGISEEAMLVGIGQQHRLPTILTHAAADIMATGFSAIGYRTAWSKSIYALFEQPVIQIEFAPKAALVNGVMPEDLWQIKDTMDFISHAHTLVFNGDFTETKIVPME